MSLELKKYHLSQLKESQNCGISRKNDEILIKEQSRKK